MQTLFETFRIHALSDERISDLAENAARTKSPRSLPVSDNGQRPVAVRLGRSSPAIGAGARCADRAPLLDVRYGRRPALAGITDGRR